MSQRSKYCLIGLPDHQGVLNVGGRIGAALGPGELRKALARMRGREPVLERLRDAGDLAGVTTDAATNHRRAADLVREEHRREGVSVVVGGGHDHGYSQLLGVLESLGKKGRLGCINIDPHLDVRKPAPLPTSGSPFYLAIEAGVLDPRRFVEFGIQAHCNGPELWEYAARKKFRVVPFEKLRHGRAARAFKQELARLSASCDAIVVSLDVDSAAQAYAPGVSAPQSEGFAPSDLIEMVEIAGATRKAVSLGIFEINPLHDIDGRTARLGATAAWHFLAAKK